MIRRIGVGVAVLGLLSGCGTSDEFGRRHAVSGSVKLDGNPLETGTIVFAPTQEGPGAQGTIEDGAYSITSSQGPTAGTYRVEIYSLQSTGQKVFDQGEGQMIEQTKNLVGPKFNLKSTLQVQIGKDGGPHDFEVESPRPTTPGKAAR